MSGLLSPECLDTVDHAQDLLTGYGYLCPRPPKTQILLALSAQLLKPLRRNRLETGLALVAPTQGQALVQLPPGTGAGGFTTLAGHFVDAAFDERATSKDNLYRTL